MPHRKFGFFATASFSGKVLENLILKQFCILHILNSFPDLSSRIEARNMQTEQPTSQFTICQQENDHLRAELAQLRQEQESLRKRDRLLSTIAQVTNLLLRSQNYQAVLPEVVRLLGEAAGSDRCGIGQNLIHPTLDKPAIRILPEWEWCKNEVLPSEQFSPNFDRLFLREIDAPYIDSKLSQGEVINCFVFDLPEPDRSLLAAQGSIAELFVPIWVDRDNWGYIAFDNCSDQRLYDEAEIAILKIAADSIAAAIERQAKDEELREAQQALLQAEQQRVAELAKTNQALKNSIDRLAAAPNINAFLGYVLQVIGEQFDSPLVEYWIHPELEEIAYLQLSCWQGQLLLPEEQPGHPGTTGLPLFLDQQYANTLRSQNYFIYQGVGTDRDHLGQVMSAQLGLDVGAWYINRGVNQYVDIPLVLGKKIIGVLSVWLPEHRTLPSQAIELAQALSHQATLAIQLTRLAEEAQQAALLEERNRMAGDIHDVLAQAFTGISVQLELARYLIHQNPTEVEQILDRISKLAQTGLTEARRSVWAVYPASEDYTDLAQNLSDCLQQLTSGTSLQTDILLFGEIYPLSSFLGKNLLRVGQEAITNSLKHAYANRLWVELTYDPDRITLRVGDDGCGFSAHDHTEGFGLIGISERVDRINGQLRITTKPNQGTEIFVQVPL
jgi:signal transduction histidine kinase